MPNGIATLPRLVGARFQVLFHSPPGVLFTFPSRYLSAIGHQGVFRLSGWSRQIHSEFHGLAATWGDVKEVSCFRLRGYHPLCRTFPSPSTNNDAFLLLADSAEPAKRPHNPRYTTPAGYHVYVVWPVPISLATTLGIAVAFSSCGY